MSALPQNPALVPATQPVATILPAVATSAPAPSAPASSTSLELLLLTEALNPDRARETTERLMRLLEVKMGLVQAEVAIQKETREAADSQAKQRLDEQKFELEQLKVRQAHERGKWGIIVVPVTAFVVVAMVIIVALCR